MKINKKSWHYWLHRILETSMYHKLERGDTASLCSYFWSTLGNMLALFWYIVVGLSMLATALILIFAVVNFLVFVITGILGLPLAWVEMELAIGTYWFCTAVAVVGSIIALSQGDIKVLPNYLKPKQAKVEPKPNLFKEYYKAWKGKVCPLVEVE